MTIPFYICLQPQNIWAPTLKMAIRSFTTQPNISSYQVGQCWIYPQQCPHAWYIPINPNISIFIILTSPKKGPKSVGWRSLEEARHVLPQLLRAAPAMEGSGSFEGLDG